ncbi:MAG: hypothetical protein JWM91_5285 [Rhodospirillales bacterium]|nr:hypothetical protein [Rhodospirillales bacterium]
MSRRSNTTVTVMGRKRLVRFEIAPQRSGHSATDKEVRERPLRRKRILSPYRQ